MTPPFSPARKAARTTIKKDRMFELAAQWRLPPIVFAEGGGGRPGDTDGVTAGMLHIKAFTLLAKLSGLVPLGGHRLGTMLCWQRRGGGLLRCHHRH